MAINLKNANIKAAIECATQFAGANKPYFGLIENAALAYADKDASGLKSRDDFFALLDRARDAGGDKRMLDSHRSEAWSCVQLGDYPCVKGIFANMRKLKSLPGLGGIYDIACSIRSRASFAKDGLNDGKGIDLDAKADVAPAADKLANALMLGNKARNKGKTFVATTLADTLDTMIKRLETERDGKVSLKGADGKPVKGDDGKSVKQPAVTGDRMDTAIAALRALKSSVSIKAVPDSGKPRRKGNGGPDVSKMSKAQLEAALRAITAAA